MILTNSEEIRDKALLLRDYGRKGRYENIIKGYNSRLDTLQAVILRVKFKYLDEWNEKRIKNAAFYTKLFKEKKMDITLPYEADYAKHIYHQYTIRIKETSDDYRYFPEPDLPPMNFSKEDIENLQNEIPELPFVKRERFTKEYRLPEQSAAVLVGFKYLAEFFEETVSELQAGFEAGKIKTDLEQLIKLTANYIITEFPKFVPTTGEIKITAENFAELIYLTFIGEVSSSGAQEVLKEMFRINGDPSQIIDSSVKTDARYPPDCSFDDNIIRCYFSNTKILYLKKPISFNNISIEMTIKVDEASWMSPPADNVYRKLKGQDLNLLASRTEPLVKIIKISEKAHKYTLELPGYTGKIGGYTTTDKNTLYIKIDENTNERYFECLGNFHQPAIYTNHGADATATNFGKEGKWLLEQIVERTFIGFFYNLIIYDITS